MRGWVVVEGVDEVRFGVCEVEVGWGRVPPY